jgi:hypothetical protein
LQEEIFYALLTLGFIYFEQASRADDKNDMSELHEKCVDAFQ